MQADRLRDWMKPDDGYMVPFTGGGMKKTGLVIVATLILGCSPGWAQDKKAPFILEPSSPWNVDYAADFCRLARTFGTGDEKTSLLIDRFAPGDLFRMTLVGEVTNAAKGGGRARIRFGTDAPEQEAHFFSGSWTGNIPAWIFTTGTRIRPRTEAEQALIDRAAKRSGDRMDIPGISEAEEAAVTEVHFGRPLRQPLVLRTGSMQAPFAAMRTCTDELLTHWGIDVTRHREQSEPATPITPPGRWLTDQDYPALMQEEGQPGLVNFRLTVGEDGRAKSCHIQQSTNPKGFDDAVCRALIRSARFTPAKDKDGKPLVSYYLNSVRFMFPRM